MIKRKNSNSKVRRTSEPKKKTRQHNYGTELLTSNPFAHAKSKKLSIIKFVCKPMVTLPVMQTKNSQNILRSTASMRPTNKKSDKHPLNCIKSGLKCDQTHSENNIHKRSSATPLKPFNKIQRSYSDLYYISDAKGHTNSYLQYNFDEPSLMVTHLLNSLTTFRLFHKISPPKQPFMSLSIGKQKCHIKGKPTIIFDMDQTLIHCQEHNEDDQQDPVVIVIDNSELRLRLFIRPYAREVLSRLAQKFEIGVFTAGRQSYANVVLDILDPDNQYFSFRLFRHHCYGLRYDTQAECLNVKDLRIINDRQLKKVVLVDNSPHTYLFQPQNGIPITSFYRDEHDKQLLKLEKFLNQIEELPDVKPYLKSYFRIEEYKKFQSVKQLVDNLY